MSPVDELNRTILLCRDFAGDELSDQQICGRFCELRVLCVSDAANLSSHSGQTALVTLVCLLSRMGMQVGLNIPDVPLLRRQPPLQGTHLRRALIASSNTLLTCASVGAHSRFNPDLVFILGDTPVESSRLPSWRLWGGDWFGRLSQEGFAKAGIWTGEWPIGAMVSAAEAASEAFKAVVRGIPFRHDGAELYFRPVLSCGWDFGTVAVPEGALRVGQVDLISAGAICQAALFVLTRIPRLEMWGSIFDDDFTAPSNLNRNMLTTAADSGPKVDVVARCCEPNFRLEPVRERFLPDSAQCRKLAPRALVGVDDIPSRWEAQRSSGGWLAVSGTSHFSVSSSSHSPGEPCCGCLHSVDDPGGAGPIPTVSFVSFWAGLAMAVRLLREAFGQPYPSHQQHLWITPLRLDERHAAMWSRVAPQCECPVRCLASRSTQKAAHSSVAA
jgi:hypothetical protein